MSPFESESLVHETLKLPTEVQCSNIKYQRYMSLQNVTSEEDNSDQQISNLLYAGTMHHNNLL